MADEKTQKNDSDTPKGGASTENPPTSLERGKSRKREPGSAVDSIASDACTKAKGSTFGVSCKSEPIRPAIITNACDESDAIRMFLLLRNPKNPSKLTCVATRLETPEDEAAWIDSAIID